MIFNKTEREEKKYLQHIITLIKKTIDNTGISIKEHVETLKEYKDYLWSNKDIDPHEIRSMRESILNHFARGEGVINKSKRLNKILENPYFGRLDFKPFNEEKNLSVYIGIHNYYDFTSKLNLIYDWRAPISSMFYDYELGEATYQTPSGEMKGEISLKRQYRIRKGKMEYIFESSLAIHDEILQKVLSSNADNKMRNIVSTIQREQNKIIRNEEAQVLIIQGVAGSGKTSIALHRIAYLLYRFQENISSQDILIISPNNVFADYISNVLPELGEEIVPETTMEQILSRILDNKYKFQNFFQQVSTLLEDTDKDFIERTRYKASFDFLNQLEQFILYIENTYFKSVEIRLTNRITIVAEFIDEQFKRFHRYPMRQRFEPMTDYILDIVKLENRITITTQHRNLVKKEIKKMFKANNDIQIYKDFFKWIGKPEMFKILKNQIIEYADLAPLAYLNLALNGVGNTFNIKHLIIDEMQDYTPVQYKIIQKLYPCKKTILGDSNQSVNPYSSSTAKMIQKIFAASEVMKLTKSYRSTYEITDFAQKIKRNDEMQPIERHGEPPTVLKYNTKEEEIIGIAKAINSFQNSDYKTLAVICKTEKQAKEMAEKLEELNIDILFLSAQSSAFLNGVITTFVHMAKGIEFDEVIIPHADNKNYSNEIDRNILYVAITRAMHKLTLTYCGCRCEFIQAN